MEWSGYDARMDKTARLAITTVGGFSLSPAGAVPIGWQFAFPGESPEIPLELVNDQIAGWTIDQLHDIAHGVPCEWTNCPLT